MTSLAQQLSTRRLERSALRERANELRLATTRMFAGDNLLVNLLGNADLWSVLMLELQIFDIVQVRCMCRAAREMTSTPWAAWWARCRLPILAPTASQQGEDWTWERLHRVAEWPSVLPMVIAFGFASDALDAAAHLQLDSLAAKLRCHPRLRIRVEGHSQRGAPPSYGHAISQARATRVRTELLLRLQGDAAWAGEEPHEGRAPAHIAAPRLEERNGISDDDEAARDEATTDEDREEDFSGQQGPAAMLAVGPPAVAEVDIEEVMDFYASTRVVGEKLQAEGVWRGPWDAAYEPPDIPGEADKRPHERQYADGQCAEVRVVGFLRADAGRVVGAGRHQSGS